MESAHTLVEWSGVQREVLRRKVSIHKILAINDLHTTRSNVSGEAVFTTSLVVRIYRVHISCLERDHGPGRLVL